MIKNLVLSAAADEDFSNIVAYTAVHFGQRQAEIYQNTLVDLFLVVASDPTSSGSKSRDEIGLGLRSIHVRAIGRNGRHLVIYRVAGGQIQILRLLHDAMDLTSQNIPPFEG